MQKPGLEAAQGTAGGLEVFPQGRSVAGARDHDAAHRVPVAADVLGRAVQFHVRAQIQRAAGQRGRKRVVHDQKRAVRPAQTGHGGDVDDAQQRVRSGLDQQYGGFDRGQQVGHGGVVRGVHQVTVHPQGRQQLVDNGNGGTVAVPRGGHPPVVTVRQGRQQGHMHRGHAGGGGHGIQGQRWIVRAECRQGIRQGPGGWVAVPLIDEVVR